MSINKLAHPDDHRPDGNDNSLLHANGVTERVISQGTLSVHTQAAQYVAALESKQRGWISRYFTDRGLTHVLQDAKVQTVKDFSEYQRNLFRLATDARLDMAHSMVLAMTRELKVGNQQRFTAMVLDKHESLRRTVQTKRESFLDEMDVALANTERYSHRPWLMDRAVASHQKEVEQYFDWVDQLLNDFMKLTQERLAEYRKAEAEHSRPALGASSFGNF